MTLSGSVQTYEVREVDGGGNDLRVIGRGTLDADSPIELPPPGRPFTVLHPEQAPGYQVLVSALTSPAAFAGALPTPSAASSPTPSDTIFIV